MNIIESRLLARPLYLQARDVLANQILAGTWKPGTSLPNEAQLAQQLGLSIGTIRKALNILERERIVTRRQGRGTFINDFSEQDRLLTKFSGPTGDEIEGLKHGKSVSTIKADKTLASRLRIETGEDVVRIDRIRCREARPFAAETAYLPARRYPTQLDDMMTCQLSKIAQKNGKLISHAEELVTAASATQQDAADLEIPEGAPVLVLDRVVYSDRQEVLEWRIARCNLGKMRMVVRYQ